MSYREQAEAAFHLIDYDDEGALAQIDALLPRAQATGDEAAVMVCRMAQERACANGDVEQSTANLQAMVTAATRLRDERLLGMAYGALASLYGCSGAMGQALAHAMQAIDWARRTGDIPTQAEAEATIGVVYHLLNDFPAAIAHTQRAISLDEQGGDALGRMIALSNLAHAYLRAEQWAETRATLDRARPIAFAHLGPDDNLIYRRLYGRLCGYEAALGLAHGDTTQAEAWVREGRRVNEEQPDKRSGQVALRLDRTLGQIYRQQGRTAEAVAVLTPLLAQLRDGSPTVAIEKRLIHSELHLLYRAAGDFEAALHHHEQLAAAREAQFNEQHIEQVRALQTLQEQARAQGVIAPLQARASALENVVQDLQGMVSSLRDLSEKDSLTGLYNRRSAESFLAAQAGAVAVVLLDADYFKQVNDRYGHAIGDIVLSWLGAHLRDATPAGGMAARWGGEEFLVILPQMNAETAGGWAEGVRRQVAAQPWGTVAAGLSVTISLGVATTTVLPTLPPVTLLRAADEALYVAKRSGRNQVRIENCGLQMTA